MMKITVFCQRQQRSLNIYKAHVKWENVNNQTMFTITASKNVPIFFKTKATQP